MVIRSLDQGGTLRVNRPFEDQFGWTALELRASPLLQWIHPQDRAGLESCLQAGSGRIVARHRNVGGEWVPLNWKVRMSDGHAVALGQFLPIVECTSTSDSETPSFETPALKQTLIAMARIVEGKAPGLKCSILLIDDAREYIVGGAGPSLPDAYNKAVEGLRIGPFVGSCGTASYWNVPVIVEDIATDPLWANLRDAAAIADVAACWSHPITSTDDAVLGAVALYAMEPSVPTAHQMDLLEMASKMIALAIERDRLEEQLRQAMTTEAIGVLAGGIAHDFNNMMATVMGNAEIALETLPEGAEASPMLSEIVTASVSASELCNQMLAYAGRGTRSREPLECNAMIKELGGLLQVALSKKASLHYELQGVGLGVLGDRSQLRRVIMNLITNASDAIGEEEGRIIIGTQAETYTQDQLEARHPNTGLKAGEYVRLWISDTGIGMDARTQARIFDPFFSTKSTGRGLGLAAAHGIVRSHSGTIRLQSKPGEGATFTILLPRTTLPEKNDRRNPGSIPPRQPERILVVDDEPQVLRVTSMMLRHAGYQVVSAKDGLEAVDLFRQEADSIDCVLLDFSMPHMGGEEVFREMRGIKHDACVILISGFTEREILERFKGAGLAGALQKPTQMKVLIAKVAAAIGAIGDLSADACHP